MADRNKFITPLHRELLELAGYHKQHILQKHKMGITDPDDSERLRMLDDVPRLVNDNIKGRENHENSKKKEKNKLLQSREKADCPRCKQHRKVKITGETTNERFGWKLDVVKCTVCKKVFANYFPNSWHERLKFMENFYSKLYEVNPEGETMAEKMQAEAHTDSVKSYESFKAFQKAQRKVEKTEQQLLEALDSAYESLVSLYDFLLLAKVNGENWTIPKSSS